MLIPSVDLGNSFMHVFIGLNGLTVLLRGLHCLRTEGAVSYLEKCGCIDLTVLA